MDLQLSARLSNVSFASYGDASYTAAADQMKSVEVLATVPSVLRDFSVARPPYEVKYDHYERLLKVDRREAERWDQLLLQASVYVFDPKPALDKLKDQYLYTFMKAEFGEHHAEWWLMNEVANDATFLMPQVWLHAVDLHDGVGVNAFRDFDAMRRSAVEVFEMCNWNYVNVRRVTLECQHIFSHVLDHRPQITSFDDTTGPRQFGTPIADVIVSIAPPVVFDEGHCRDLSLLDSGRVQQRQRIAQTVHRSALPAHLPGRIELANSKKDFRLQVADVAAGKARDLYLAKGGSSLTEHFTNVIVNGCRLSARPAPFELDQGMI